MRGEIARLLARWRSTASSVSKQSDDVDRRAIEAAVVADSSGWLALLDDGRLVACGVEGDRESEPGESPDLIMRALKLLDGAEHESDAANVDAARLELNEWIARDWTRRSSGLDVVESPMRRRMRRALDEALHAAPRHQRARSLERAARVRRALDRPLPLGLERALDALVDTASTSSDWLEAVADRIVRVPGDARDQARGAARCRVLIVFIRDAAPRRSE